MNQYQLKPLFVTDLLQLFSLIAMERPIRHDSEAIRDEKVKLLRCVKPIACFVDRE